MFRIWMQHPQTQMKRVRFINDECFCGFWGRVIGRINVCVGLDK